MAVIQAAEALHLFTGKHPDAERMRCCNFNATPKP